MTRIVEVCAALIIVPANELGEPLGLCSASGCRKAAVVTLTHKQDERIALPLCGEHYGILLKYAAPAPAAQGEPREARGE